MRTRWTNEEGVLKLVKQRLQELRDEYVAAIFTGRPVQLPREAKEAMDRLEKFPGPDQIDEQAAVDAAKGGDLRPLAYHFLLPDPDPDMDPDTGEVTKVTYEVNDRIAHLRPETWLLIVEFLLRERNLKTGKKKGEPGRPRMTEEERRAKAPVHDAADLMQVIVEILRNMFPEQRPKDIRDRALLFAAKIKRMPSETLANYLGRSQRDHRRL